MIMTLDYTIYTLYTAIYLSFRKYNAEIISKWRLYTDRYYHRYIYSGCQKHKNIH